MKTQIVEVSIRGISALLQHRFSEDAQLPGTSRKQLIEELTPREEATKVVYQNSEGFYFPGAAIARLLREAGAGHKMKGTRKSAKWLVPAAVIVEQEAITICNGDGRTPAEDFDVDSRPVTIPATKGRIMRHRPRFDDWSASFSLAIDTEVLPETLIHTLLTEGGSRIGVGDFRPEKGGPFGRFQVTRWDPKD